MPENSCVCLASIASSALIVAPVNYDVISVEGKRGGVGLGVVCVPAILDMLHDLSDGGFVRA